MRLLFISLNYAPEPTATGRYTGEMAEWLAARGHDVDLIAGLPHYPSWQVDPRYRRVLPFLQMLNGVRVMRTPHFVPSPSRVTSLGRIAMEISFSLMSLTWWIRIFFRRKRYDAVIAICPPIEDAVMPLLYRLVRRVPCILHVQDFQVDAAVRLGLLRGGSLGRLLYSVENFLLRQVAVVSSISPAMCRRAAEKGVDEERTWLVPNWAHPRIRPGPADNSFRRELAIDPGDVLIMYAGAIGKKQGLDCLLDAANLLRHEPQIQFAVIGAGADHARLVARAAELALPNLRLLPVQDEDRLTEVLASAEIHLVIQRRHAADLVMPSKLANIMAAGRPTIATADPGTALWDVLEGGGTGVCVPPDNPAALASAIDALALDRLAISRMGREAYEYCTTKLDKESILTRFEDQLKFLITCH